MGINHDITRAEIIAVRDTVRGIAKKAEDFNNQKGKIIKDEYRSEKAKSEAIYALSEQFKTVCQKVDEQVQKSLDRILAAELENNKIFDITDPAIQSAIQLITATSGKIDVETRKDIVNLFRGNAKALVMLHDVFTAYDIDVKYLEKCMINIEEIIDHIRELSGSMAEDAAESAHQMQEICLRLFNLAELLGIPFEDAEKETNLNLDEYYMSMARAAMGL